MMVEKEKMIPKKQGMEPRIMVQGVSPVLPSLGLIPSFYELKHGISMRR